MGHIKEIIDYFFKHDVPDSIKPRVYKRLVRPHCDNERYEALKGLWNKIPQAEAEGWEKAYRNVYHAIHNEDKKPHSINPLFYLIRIAAMWFVPFVMLCTSVYFYIESRRPVAMEIPRISYVQHYAEAGTCEQVRLPDGSTVWLNSGSTLVYPSTFASSERGVYLIGEGFFDVAKDSAHPFVVNTRFLKMQVIGTTFNVSAYPDDTQVKTTLETGALEVNINNDTTKSYHLIPDNQLVYTPSTNKVEQFDVRASDYSDWRMGGLFLNNINFNDAMRLIERSLGVKVHIRTSVYDKQKIYVHYNKNESLENIFHILKIMIPELEYKISGKDVYVE